MVANTVEWGGGPGLIGACFVPVLRGHYLGTKEVVEGGHGVGEAYPIEGLRGAVNRGKM